MEFFDTLCRVIFYFMIYSVVGWIYETTLCSITDRRFVNRGFLNGPYCPIYGSGALLDVLVLGRIENPFLLFILGVLVTCSLEYLTSYVMEKLFKARWWDYSDKKFNIGGRVCLLGAVVFGLFSVVLIKLLHPAVRSLADMLPDAMLYIISCVFAVGFIVDLAVTVAGFASFNKRLEELSHTLAELRSDAVEKLSELGSGAAGKLSELGTEAADKLRSSSAATRAKLNSVYESFTERLNLQQRRMLSAFPKLRSASHNTTLFEIKQRIRDRRNRGRSKRENDGDKQ